MLMVPNTGSPDEKRQCFIGFLGAVLVRVFKQCEITGFNGFQPESPVMSVIIRLSLAKIRPNGVFRRFNRFAPIPRLPNTDLSGEA